MDRKITKENTETRTETRTPAKRNNTMMIVVIVIIAVLFLLAVCCFASGIAGSIGSAIDRAKIEKQVEDSLGDITPTPALGVDTNADKTKTQPIPSDLPSEGKNIIPASWGNPYNVNKSTGTPNQFTLLFSAKGNSTSFASIVESNIKKAKWAASVIVDEETEATIVTGNKKVNGIDYTVNIRLQQQGDDTDITFVLNY